MKVEVSSLETKKVCTKCGVRKYRTAFGLRSCSKDGLRPECRVCQKIVNDAYRDRLGVILKERYRTWRDNHREQFNEALRRWAKRNAGRYPYQNTIQVQARRAIAWRVRDGYLVKPTQCSRCGRKPGSRKLHAHHKDYRKPLQVEWLCSLCHGKEHWIL